MHAEERESSDLPSRRHVSRLMLVLADGCRVCVALEAVEGVFDLAAEGGEDSPDAGDSRLPVVRWGDLIGVPPPAGAPPPSQMLVLRTPAGRAALAVERCLGVRDAAFGSAAVLPTTWTDGSGEAWCWIHLLDGKTHFILDPRALDRASSSRSEPPVAEPDGASTVRT